MTNRILAGIVLALFAVAGAAFSQERGAESGLYVAAGAGIALVPEYTGRKLLKDGKTVTSEDAVPLYTTYDLGWSARGAVGFYIGGGTRAEAEFSYLFVGTKEFNGMEKKAFKEAPQLTVISVMANGLYELDTGTPLRPFIGLGVGPALTSISLGELKSAADQEDYDQGYEVAAGWSAAYQATAGVAYEVFDGFDVRLAYRYFELPFRTLTYERKFSKDDPEYRIYDTEIGSAFAPGTTAHRIEVGVTYRFARP